MRAFQLAVLPLVMLSGCASNIMKGYVGKPLQTAMVQYGPPTTAFDMPDGRRAFQWVMSSTFIMPTTQTTTGTITPMGNSAMWTQNTQIYGGGPVTSKCAYTLIAQWSEASHAWMVESYAKPSLACE